MTPVLLLLSLFAFSLTFAGQPWPCKDSKSYVVKAFQKKKLMDPLPKFRKNPYSNQTKESSAHIKKVLQNRTIVCAAKYMDSGRVKYVLKQFDSKTLANNQGFIVTHQGRCGACSSMQDLAVYLGQPDLTNPVRKCALKNIISTRWARGCLEDIGFSERCSDIWLYNTANTRSDCFGVCMKSWLKGEPNNLPDGSLNKCLQCDEDMSGPIFKYFSGRTRRDSGIQSAIHRPAAQVYKMTHCYY